MMRMLPKIQAIVHGHYNVPSRSMMKTLLTALLVLLVSLTSVSETALRYVLVKRELVESRLKSFSKDDGQRELILKNMFRDVGCGDHIAGMEVKHEKYPNLVCVLPGESEDSIIVGAHFDHASRGDGVVDNWSGASLLPSLYEGLHSAKRRHTFIFICFTGEEHGDVGSASYVNNMTPAEVARTLAMINIDTLGLGPTAVWLSHADPRLASTLVAVAKSVQLGIGAVNVERVGTSDSEQFARRKIPRLTIHSITQDTLSILHSPRDNLSAVKWNDYYDSYRLLSAYLTYLDLQEAERPVSPTK